MKIDNTFKSLVLMSLAFMVNYFKRYTGNLFYLDLQGGEKFFLDAINWNYALHQLAVIVLAIAAVVYLAKAVKAALGKK